MKLLSLLTVIVIIQTIYVTRVSAIDCTKGSECPIDHCCISKVQPIGRRQLFNNGYCAPLPGKSDSCMAISFSSSYLDGMVYGCPCRTGLKCVENGFFSMPFRMGNCA